jgi:hypothetical protein
MNNNISSPLLVEPGVKYFLNATLKECNEYKNKFNNIVFNLFILFIFVFILGIILLYRYKGKPTKVELEIKNRKKQEYIISKLQEISNIKKNMNDNLITDLPNWSDHPELQLLNNKNLYNNTM